MALEMPVTLGAITLDEQLVSKQLRNDFKDDWFPDPIGYEDFFEKGLLSEIITSNFEQNHGEYQPSPALLLNVPKANFTLRYALETSITDRAIYHALAAQLLPVFDGCIDWRVFSHRLDLKSVDSDAHRSSARYTFRNGVMSWGDFLGCVSSKLDEGKFLLSTDLANYFENITLQILKDGMLSLIPVLTIDASQKSIVRNQIEQLFSYLSRWSYKTDRGLPQNRDASSFFANLYMRPVDNAMIAAGFEYFRYMDDIKIICSNEGAARKALKALILALRPLGQVVNSGKTRIVSASDMEGVRECTGSGSPDMKRINAAWQTKSLKPIVRSFVPLKKLALATLNAGRYDSREFRFCISRLETLARCSEFAVPPAFFDEITPLVIAGLDQSPVSTDQICRYLRAVQVNDVGMQTIADHLTDENRTLYNWKNYRIWILLAQKAYDSDELKTLARRLVQEREDDPTRAGATVYLGTFGSSDDRNLIAQSFKVLTSFLGQRSAIIGAQEVHFSSRKSGGISIGEHVAPHLRADLKGAYRALERSGRYVSELEPVSITRWVDLERDYD